MEAMDAVEDARIFNNNTGNYEPSNSAAMVVDNDDDEYVPSPITCAQALQRANQARVSALLSQLLNSQVCSTSASNSLLAKKLANERVDVLRVLGKSLRELDYQLSWSLQQELLTAIGQILEENSTISSADYQVDEWATSWRLAQDATELLADFIPRAPHELEPARVGAIFGLVVENLGHSRSELRRSSLLLLNLYLQERPGHLIKLLIERGLLSGTNRNRKRAHSMAIQRGAILSLPLLMTEHICSRAPPVELGALVRALADLLVDSASSQLFYSLYLALRRLQMSLGERRFAQYLRTARPEAALLYRQAASRSGSLATPSPDEPSDESTPSIIPATPAPEETPSQTSHEQQQPQQPQQQRQVTFEDAAPPAADRRETPDEAANSSGDAAIASSSRCSSSSSSSSSISIMSTVAKPRQQVATSGQQLPDRASSVSSTCSSEANLVDPAHYMSAAALSGRPLDDYHPRAGNFDGNNEQLDEHTCTGLAINDLCVSCSPTQELGPHELKFGIFPRHLVQAALMSNTSTGSRVIGASFRQQKERIYALDEMMRLVRESPVNHLAILITYFDAFLEQFLTKLLLPTSDALSSSNSGRQEQQHLPDGVGVELIALDMIESIVIKTKASTMHFIRPMIALLVRVLARTKSGGLLRAPTCRLMHKMMAYLPPQHVIDALFEHKHSKSGLVREEILDRVTAAVIEYERNEFNLTKLCYHALPMLADPLPQVRMAALECIAALAQALGPERIGSLLTAAEAVQTGCDLSGLLDAIHARLKRRAPPRINPDASVRHLIRPLLVHEQAGANQPDVRWVLEAPHLTWHASSGQAHSLNAEPDPGERHTPAGHYSPANWQQQHQRRCSFAAIGQHDLEEPEHHHHHHHHHPHHYYQNHTSSSEHLNNVNNSTGLEGEQQRRQPADPVNLTRSVDRELVRSSTQAPTNTSIDVQVSVGGGKESGSGKGVDQPQKSENNRRHFDSEQQTVAAPATQPNRRKRSSSQESNASSSDTNKVLFQYYLAKFRQSLSESADNFAYSTNNNSTSKQAALPSDSIIYADLAQAYELTSKHKSRQQQTSFDYEPNSVARNSSVIQPVKQVVPSLSREASISGTLKSSPSAEQQLNNEKPNDPVDADEPDEEPEGKKVSSCVEKNRRPSKQQQVAESSEPVVIRKSSSLKEDEKAEDENEEQQESQIDKIVPATRMRAGLVRQSASTSMIGPDEVDTNENERQSDQPVRSEEKPVHDEEEADTKTLKRGSSLGAESQASSRADQSDHATQTSPQPELSRSTQTTDGADDRETRESARRARRISRRSSSTHRLAQQQTSGRASEHEQASDGELRRVASRNSDADEADEEEEGGVIERRRESRSQPPASQLRHKTTTTTAQNRMTRNNEQRQVVVAERRSVSVSPSLAASANIRHILESVAQVEGQFQEPELAYRVASEALASPCWSTKVEGILALIRLAVHHPELLLEAQHLHETVARLAHETSNLRSTVARAAIFTLGELAFRLRRALEPESDVIVRALLERSSENTTAFIRDDIRRALLQMTDTLVHWRLASQLIAHGSSHKHMQVRRMAAQFVANLVERMGAAKCLVGARDISAKLLPAAAKFAQDSSPHTRYYGRLILARLMQHGAFERLLRKNLTPNLYRSTLGVIESVRRRGAGDPPPDC